MFFLFFFSKSKRTKKKNKKTDSEPKKKLKKGDYKPKKKLKKKKASAKMAEENMNPGQIVQRLDELRAERKAEEDAEAQYVEEQVAAEEKAGLGANVINEPYTTGNHSSSSLHTVGGKKFKAKKKIKKVRRLIIGDAKNNQNNQFTKHGYGVFEGPDFNSVPVEEQTIVSKGIGNGVIARAGKIDPHLPEIIYRSTINDTSTTLINPEVAQLMKDLGEVYHLPFLRNTISFFKNDRILSTSIGAALAIDICNRLIKQQKDWTADDSPLKKMGNNFSKLQKYFYQAGNEIMHTVSSEQYIEIYTLLEELNAFITHDVTALKAESKTESIGFFARYRTGLGICYLLSSIHIACAEHNKHYTDQLRFIVEEHLSTAHNSPLESTNYFQQIFFNISNTPPPSLQSNAFIKVMESAPTQMRVTSYQNTKNIGNFL